MAEVWQVEFIAYDKEGEAIDWFGSKKEAVAAAMVSGPGSRVVKRTEYLVETETVWSADDEEQS